MADRLTAINRRELWALSASEKAKVIGLTTTAATRQGTKVGNAADAAADRVWESAATRVQAEDAAAARVRAQKVQEKADRKAARKWF